MSRTLYPARIDWGVSVLLAGMAIACLGLGLVSLFLPPPSFIGGIVLLMTGALLQSIWMRTYYQIDEEELRIQCGPLWWTIPLKHIYSVEKTSSLWLMVGGPHLRFSLSRRGLMIRYRRHVQHKWFGLFDPTVLISPSDRDQFLANIRALRPDLMPSLEDHQSGSE